jgi:O-antigen/teichoic acid export membrane protein
MQRISSIFRGDGLAARAKRGSLLTILNFGGNNALRLASNLILTRILFPEAFGLMALVHVFLTGLQMFSDVGLQASVIRSNRGADPVFLNTTWTVQILRGAFLWLLCVALAAPVAGFYEEDMLRDLLPVVGLNALILGFASINIFTVNRNMLLGRLTMLELGAQIIGIVVTIAAALILQSVWALVIGGLVGSFAKTVLSHVILPGERPRLAYEHPAFLELFGFGKWIFLATIANFVIRRGDLVILGKYISLTELGFYNIAIMIATIPAILNMALIQRILFPLLCNRPPGENAQNRTRILRARVMLTGLTCALCAPAIVFGQEIIILLYDPRYYSAGVILVALAVQQLYVIITAGHDQALLAAGNSRTFAVLMIADGIVRIGVMLIGVTYFGLIGVVAGMIVGQLVMYPVRVSLIWRYGSWDWRHDLGFAFLGVAFLVLAGLHDSSLWAKLYVLAQPSAQ